MEQSQMRKKWSRKMKRILKLLLMFAILSPCVSFACDLCGCFIPTDSVIKGFRFGFAQQYSDFATVQLDGEQVPNPDQQKLNSWNTQFYGNYHFNERFALQLNIPLIYKSFRRPEGNQIQTGTESGIGDMSLIGYYVPFQRKNPFSQATWRIVAGIKFPTGNSDPIGEELHESDESPAPAQEPSGIHGHDIALGSGSYDGLVGTSFFQRWTKTFVTANVQYAIRTHGSFDYKYANDLIWYGGPGYYFAAKQNYSFGLQALLTGEYKGEDELGNVKTDDTAITAVYLGPVALVGVGQGLQAEVGVGFPLLINNSGFQSVPTYRFRAGLVWQWQ
jgi:hypothetical protein